MFAVPFYHRSIFDDVDTVFDDLLWDTQRMLPARRRLEGVGSGEQQQAKNWTATVPLPSFRPNEVQFEMLKDKSAIKVQARREDGDDYSEVRRSVQIPDTVDRDQVQVDFTREGVLVVKAPYLQQQQQRKRGGVAGGQLLSRQQQQSQELRTLENELWSLGRQSFPGSMSSQLVPNEDGGSQLAMEFGLEGYRPEEISVSNEGQLVSVEAKHETKSDYGSSFKHFKRVFSLPENVKADQLKSRLLPDGRLRLEAPYELKEEEKEQPAIGDSGHDIAVQRTASQQRRDDKKEQTEKQKPKK